MGKMFYTLDETKALLGKNEEEVKQLAREGRLREFRDGPRIMFKAEQVDLLKGEVGGGDAIALSPSESGAPIGLAGDSRAGSGLIGMADSAAGKKAATGTGLTNLTAGLSGSGLSSGAGSGGAPRGITVFDVDDSQQVDPSAQTAIHASVPDQVNLDAAGSGSGLLDLTRESDETSLGAVFDEIAPSPGATGMGRGRSGASQLGASAIGMEIAAGNDRAPAVDRSIRPAAAPIYVEAPDALATGLGAASLVGVAVLCFGGFVLGSVLLGYRPEILKTLDQGNTGMMYLAAAAGAAVLFTIIGFFVGKAASK